MFYLQCKHSCMHNAALTIRRRRLWMPVSVYEKGKMKGATQLQVFNWHSDGSFWNGPNIIGCDSISTLWCILWHFCCRRYLPPSWNSSSPHASSSHRPSDKTSSSLKAYKWIDASDAQRSISLKLDWPQLLYLGAREQTHTRTQAWKQKHSFLKAGPLRAQEADGAQRRDGKKRIESDIVEGKRGV